MRTLADCWPYARIVSHFLFRYGSQLKHQGTAGFSPGFFSYQGKPFWAPIFDPQPVNNVRPVSMFAVFVNFW